MMNHIEVGYVYEIDHIYLPPRTPAQLRSIRVAMVCEKTEMNVVVRYPSMDSLRALFSYRTEYPDLDEKFVMGKALASKLLFRLVPPEILSEQKSLQGFWLISDSLKYIGDLISEKHDLGGCFSELKCNGMVRWGIRRQVRYLGRHRESDDIGTKNIYVQNSSSNLVNGVEKGHMNLLGDDCDVKESESEEEEEEVGDDDDDGDGINGEKKVKEEDEDEEEEEEEEEEDEYEEKKILKSNKNLKRKRYFFRNSANRKKPKKENQNKKRNKNKNRTRFNEALVVLKNPEHRWSSGRYNLAEQNLLEVMKAKGATAEKPILRPKLRAEARKRIGDTGLLDHLLKHIAGKIAPGGEQRFRRRHNADGAMEYWLESAELVNIRNDVGITDPYWVPPPGWTPGDSPTQDPLCAKELKLLKDDVLVIKRELELGVTRKQLEEEIAKLRREVDELSSELSLKKRQQEENQLIAVISSPCEITQKFDHFAHSLTSSKIDPPVPLEKYKEQLLVISDFVKEMKVLNPKRARSDNSTLMVPEKKQVYKQQQEVQAFIAAGNERTEFQNKSLENAASIEQKSNLQTTGDFSMAKHGKKQQQQQQRCNQLKWCSKFKLLYRCWKLVGSV
ncbi:hypothetical protein ACJIZ3_009392 [Penstemon smallii]|uniref:PTC1-like winged helix-turn-helix domain-containing protein n=1 Tax=Penstemon smallii TaxID=265156 RepID=A0ABD3TDH7_9LAMI